MSGKLKPNLSGVYDMTGNMNEWCYDWYSEDYFVNSPKSNPLGPKQGWGKVIKGGSIESSRGDCDITNRYNSSPETSKYSVGFRLARPAAGSEKK